ncbi:MAG: hypothetical protein KTR31_39740 [Myxococcales bacterium]|nr:hypothetical protein [Myxococcales bacterium]
MSAERLIQEALQAAGDPSGAFLWRRVCRDLDGDFRVGVVARDEAVVHRLIRGVHEDLQVEWVTLRLEDAQGDLAPSLGAQDRMLGVHALIWATPATAPLGAEERSGMEAVVEAGAPTHRAVAVADLALLQKMSDDPETEAADVMERVQALMGGDWGVVRGDGLAAWVTKARERHTELIVDRRRTVAGLLLKDARKRAQDAVEQADVEVGRVDDLLSKEDEALESARRAGQRVAAHILGAMRRETESLLVDLGTFLVELESDIPTQVERVPELERVRRTLPLWLHHVVEEWMEERLVQWRVRVLDDLAEVKLLDDDLDRAQLLVPGLHPPPVRGEENWGQRIGVTATIGGGAAMLLMGFWVPGVLAVTGGIAWSALGRRAAEASNRRALIQAAVDAVRGMGQDADRLLRDQIRALEDQLDQLGEERADLVAADRLQQRSELQAQRVARQERARALHEVLEDLDRRIEALGSEVPA